MSGIIEISPSIWEAQESRKKTDLQARSLLQFWSKSVTFLEILPKDPSVELSPLLLMAPTDQGFELLTDI